MSNYKEEITSNKSRVKGIFYRTRKIGRTKRWVSVHTLDGNELIPEMYVPQLGNRATIQRVDELLIAFQTSLSLDYTLPAEEMRLSPRYAVVFGKINSIILEEQKQKYTEQYKYQRKNAEGKSRKH